MQRCEEGEKRGGGVLAWFLSVALSHAASQSAPTHGCPGLRLALTLLLLLLTLFSRQRWQICQCQQTAVFVASGSGHSRSFAHTHRSLTQKRAKHSPLPGFPQRLIFFLFSLLLFFTVFDPLDGSGLLFFLLCLGALWPCPSVSIHGVTECRCSPSGLLSSNATNERPAPEPPGECSVHSGQQYNVFYNCLVKLAKLRPFS